MAEKSRLTGREGYFPPGFKQRSRRGEARNCGVKRVFFLAAARDALISRTLPLAGFISTGRFPGSHLRMTTLSNRAHGMGCPLLGQVSGRCLLLL